MAVVRNLMVRAGADFSKMRQEMQKAQQDLQKFKSSVNKTLGLIGTGLAALGIGKGLKDSVAAINHTIEQETKLATVMRKTMGATDDVIQSLFSLADAQEAVGVVSADAQKAGAAELSTYLTKANSLKQLIPALNDLTAAQYGFTASAEQSVGLATMLGKVMDGQVGALSRYGFTFDKAQEKILKYGSEAQRAALLVEIISDSVGGMNEALGQTPEGRMLVLKNTLGSIRSEIGRGVLPIIMKLLPYLQAVANWFLRAAQAVSAFTAALFGKVDTGIGAGAIDAQAESVDELGGAYEDAEKKAKKAQKTVAGFDQVNLVGEKSSKDKSKDGLPKGGIGGIDFDASPIGNAMSEVGEKARAMADKVKNAFQTMKFFIVSNKDIIISALAGLAAAFATFWVASKWGSIVAAVQGAGRVILGVLASLLSPVAIAGAAIAGLVAGFVYFYRTNEKFRDTVQTILQKIGEAAQTLWNAVMIPFGSWLADVMPKAWDAVSTAAKWLWTNVLVPLGNFVKWLWDNVFAPFGRWLADVMPKAWDAVTKASKWLWQNVLVPFGKFLKELWDNVLVPLGKVLIDVLAIAFQTVADIAKDFWQKVLVPLGKALSEMFGPAVEAASAVLKYLWNNVLIPMAKFLADTYITAWKSLTETITFLWKYVFKPLAEYVGGAFKMAFSNAFDTISGLIGGLKTTYIGLMNFITGVFTGDWRKAWNGVKDIFKGVFDSLYTIVKHPLNLIIESINKVIEGINSISFDVPDWLPDWAGGGKSFGITIPKIPKLAKGGLAFGPTLSVVGDNPGASANPEVIAPLNKLKDYMDNSNDKEVNLLGQILQVLKQGNTQQGGGGIGNMTITDLARMITREQNAHSRMAGRNLNIT